MVELEQRPVEFLTFKHADVAATIPVQATYIANDVMKINSALGINLDPLRIYEAIRRLAPNSKVPNQDDLRITHSLTQHDLQIVVNYFIESHEAKKNKNIRSFKITDDEIIHLGGITDQKWAICKPLLCELRTTRKQTESGEIQITPIPFKEVRKFFPEKISQQTIFKLFKILNTAMNLSGWSIIRAGEGPKKPVDAPWFLEGPNDNGVQNKGEPKQPKKENIFDMGVNEQKKRVAEAHFDRMAFGTNLLHCCVSNLTNPEVIKHFTNDPKQLMNSRLPPDLKLAQIIDKETPLEYFQATIRYAVNNMAGKTYEELSAKQQEIMKLWNTLRIDSGQPPALVILEHFSKPNSNKPLGQGNNDTGNLGEVIIMPKRTRGRARGKNKDTS